jgi:hypothetical protein
MDFAERVLGLADGRTPGLNPSYMRPFETGAIVLLFSCSSCFSLLLFACSAVAPFPSLFQWLFLYLAHIDAL